MCGKIYVYLASKIASIIRNYRQSGGCQPQQFASCGQGHSKTGAQRVTHEATGPGNAICAQDTLRCWTGPWGNVVWAVSTPTMPLYNRRTSRDARSCRQARGWQLRQFAYVTLRYHTLLTTCSCHESISIFWKLGCIPLSGNWFNRNWFLSSILRLIHS